MINHQAATKPASNRWFWKQTASPLWFSRNFLALNPSNCQALARIRLVLSRWVLFGWCPVFGCGLLFDRIDTCMKRLHWLHDWPFSDGFSLWKGENLTILLSFPGMWYILQPADIWVSSWPQEIRPSSKTMHQKQWGYCKVQALNRDTRRP